MNTNIISDFLLVLVKILSMFFVMLLGWIMRRGSFLDDNATTKMSKVMLNFVFPALILPFMLKTVTPQVLAESWHIPLFGFFVIILAQLAALVAAPFFCDRERCNEFVFIAGSPNWIFLPLPIVEGLFGADGVRAILLYNAGAQLALWTVGVSIMRGKRPDLQTLKSLLNPGLVAIAAGIFIALAVPGAHRLAVDTSYKDTALTVVFSSLLQSFEMVGSLTIPLALIVIGSRLGGLKAGFKKPGRQYTGIILARLIVGPVLTGGVFFLARAAGLNVPHMTIMIGYLISTMPVAVTTIAFVEHYGGDRLLCARVIFDSTLFSIITVPLFYYLALKLGI